MEILKIYKVIIMLAALVLLAVIVYGFVWLVGAAFHDFVAASKGWDYMLFTWWN